LRNFGIGEGGRGRYEVAVHRHPNSNENVILITGKIYEILYEETENGGTDGNGTYISLPCQGKIRMSSAERCVAYSGSDRTLGDLRS
jgi:hypothetical protein